MMETKTLPVVTFYNRIAGEYNEHMTDEDREVRRRVGRLFAEFVPRGNVLDFGGGTGLDLPWLLGEGYHVFFLEPSPEMRKIARRSVLPLVTGMPVFLEEGTDILEWSEGNLPFNEKMQGILADFAVLNCLEDVNVFFEKISLVSGEGSHIVACVLDLPWFIVLRRYGMRKALLMLGKGCFGMPNSHESISHKTCIRSIRRFRLAARPYFELTDTIRLAGRHFSLLIFKR